MEIKEQIKQKSETDAAFDAAFDAALKGAKSAEEALNTLREAGFNLTEEESSRK